MSRGRASLKKRRSGREGDGFTLIELLVVITILGILAAIVVFAVKGIGDKGKSASIATDAAVLRTAQEAYCAKNGSYASAQKLVDDKFLTSKPTYNSVVLTSGSCGNAAPTPDTNTGFIVGSPAADPTSGELVLAASNNQPGFRFLSGSAPNPVKFTFDKSGTLKTTANTFGNTAVLFASADQANVDGTIGTCAATATPNLCGIASTKRLYAVGQLVAFSCTANGQTLPPATGAPTCSKPPANFQTALPDLATLRTRLLGNSALKLAIADPGNALAFGGTLAGTPTCTTNLGAGATAPYGGAAVEALLASSASGTGGAGMSCAEFGAMVCSGQIFGPAASAAFCGGPAVAAGGNNVSATQDKVVGGAVEYALIPYSFVKSPNGDDTTNNVLFVPRTSHSVINQYAVVLAHGTTAQRNVGVHFLNYIGSTQGQAVLAQFGYDPIGAYTNIPDF